MPVNEGMEKAIRKTFIEACCAGQVDGRLVWGAPITTMHRVCEGAGMLTE